MRRYFSQVLAPGVLAVAATEFWLWLSKTRNAVPLLITSPHQFHAASVGQFSHILLTHSPTVVITSDIRIKALFRLSSISVDTLQIRMHPGLQLSCINLFGLPYHHHPYPFSSFRHATSYAIKAPILCCCQYKFCSPCCCSATRRENVSESRRLT